MKNKIKGYWLSFVDPERPKGTRFIGVALVEADDFGLAVQLAHRKGCNPGGEVAGEPIPKWAWDAVLESEKHRVLTAEQAAVIDARWIGAKA